MVLLIDGFDLLGNVFLSNNVLMAIGLCFVIIQYYENYTFETINIDGSMETNLSYALNDILRLSVLSLTKKNYQTDVTTFPFNHKEVFLLQIQY